MNNMARFESIKNAVYWNKTLCACNVMLEMIRCYQAASSFTDAEFMYYVKAFQLCGDKIDRIIARNRIVVEGLLDEGLQDEDVVLFIKVIFVRGVASKKKDM